MADAGGPYLLGLDAGNTVIKAVLFDLAGRQLAAHALDGRSHAPRPGHVERDLRELWTMACQAIRACILQAGIDPAAIAGIGCAGHGNGLYLLDKAGEPLLGIQSLDTRAANLAQRISASAGDALHRICLQKPWPSQTPTLLAWVKEHAPEIYARTGTVLLCKDFLTYRLTGERVSDLSDMSGCGMLRMPQCAYDEDLMALYGLEEAVPLLPRLVDPAAIAGRVTDRAAAETGLAAGTPVIGGFFDVIASALGSGAGQPGEASIIVGTWSINQVFSERPVIDPSVFMISGFGDGLFANIESSATSAANLEWYVRELVERGGHQDDPFGRCGALAASVDPAPDDPFFHPFLYGSRLSPDFRAGLYGVAGWHREAHLLRALFEGVMFEHRRHVEVLAEAGVSFDRAVLSGGGSRSALWPQMFADGLGVPITVAEAREAGALGAAIGEAVGLRLFDGYPAAMSAMARPAAVFLPDPAMACHYDERYSVYKELTGALRGFWSKLRADVDRRGAGGEERD